MSKILVTGANGFIGANIVRACIEKGYNVRAFVRKTSDLSTIKNLPIEFAFGDLRDRKSLENAIEDCDFIIHNGAIYSWLPKWWMGADPGKVKSMYDVNVRSVNLLFQIAKEKRIKKVIYTSSESAIGIPNEGSIANEEHFASKKELSGHYKISKYLGERVAFKWNKKGIDVCTILPTVPIGAYDIKPTPTGRILRDFMNGAIPVYVDTGLNIVHVKDVAMAHVLAIENGKPGNRYIAGNKNLTFLEFLRLAADVVGKKAPKVQIPLIIGQTFAFFDEFISVNITKKHPNTPLESVSAARYRQFDCSKSWNELKMPKTNLRIAIKDETDWFKNNGYLND